MSRLGLLMGVLVAGLLGLACGGDISSEQARRSMTQYELAVGLNQEGNTPGAFRALANAVELDPRNARAHLLLGTLFLINREDDTADYDRKAERSFQEVLKIQAGEHAVAENLAADAHNKLGVLYIHEGRFSEAVRELETAVGDLFNRKAYMAWGNLGWAYSEMGKHKQALRALLQAIKLQPRFCVGYFRLGEVHAEMRDFEKAEKALTQAIEAHQGCSAFQEAWHLRGQVRAKLGERQDAIADLERCVELAPDSDAGQACARLLEKTH